MATVRRSRALLVASAGLATLTFSSCTGGGCIAGNLMAPPPCPDGTYARYQYANGWCVTECPPGALPVERSSSAYNDAYCVDVPDAGTDAGGGDAGTDAGP